MFINAKIIIKEKCIKFMNNITSTNLKRNYYSILG